MPHAPAKPKLLLIDTCGVPALLGLAFGEQLIAQTTLAERTASTSLLSALRTLLQECGWTLADVTAVGVVNGPGSFTGVRTGLAAAKGICEALGIPLFTISRLAVLAAANESADAVAVLDAGRNEVYLRSIDGQECIVSRDALLHANKSLHVIVAEQTLADQLEILRPQVTLPSLAAALPLLLAKLAAGGPDEILSEANYVRAESSIYATARPPVTNLPTP